MTAEAIVMNRSAVALAADSAVTIGRPGSTKTFETANKLFELIKGSNVGVMIYSAASINGTPWETIIKTYRREYSGFSAEHVEDYAGHFIDFVSDHTGLLTVEDEVFTVIIQLSERLNRKVLQPLLRWPESLISASSGRIVQTRVRRALSRIIDLWQEEIDRTEDIELDDNKRDEIIRTFRPVSDRLVVTLFDQYTELQPTVAQLKILSELAVKTLPKVTRRSPGTGLVFAGFGTKDYVPAMCSARISSRLCGTVLFSDGRKAEISMREPAFLETFAQDGPAKGWINGIHDDVRTGVMQEWTKWVRSPLRREAVQELVAKGFDLTDARKAASVFQQVAKKQLGNFEDAINELENENFRKPMERSIAVLPKDELGLLAESLVNLTSLRQRMSINQQNTVGGAIDVAVISIGDGFVWLNRKHYFNTELNPTWHLTHGASIKATLTEPAGEDENV